jgi:glutamyl/glutaminyl-tRNA synthetase
LEARRQAAVRAKLPPIYDRRCLSLPAPERAELLRQGVPHTIRLAVRASTWWWDALPRAAKA